MELKNGKFYLIVVTGGELKIARYTEQSVVCYGLPTFSTGLDIYEMYDVNIVIREMTASEIEAYRAAVPV